MAAISLLVDAHEEVSRLQTLHGVQFDDEALFLAARIATKNQTVGGVREKFIDILNKACEFREDHTKELNKRKYILRRSLIEYKQLVKDKVAKQDDGFCWLSHVEKELKDGFIDLLRFMKLRMHLMHDDFVSGVHEADRVGDYAQILNQLDAKVHYEFKKEITVGIREIASVASEITGIPASWYVTKPEERFLRLQEQLRKRVFGQYINTVESITEVLLEPKTRSTWSRRPLGTFLFAGPYCVGKSDLAKAIANELYDDEDRLIQFDMEKYMEPASVSYLVGSFTETLKNKPYSVILFDKIEKAHSSVIDYLLGIISSTNEVPRKKRRDAIDFKNSMIIMTSDLDEEHFRELMAVSASRRDNKAKRFLKPELLNLVDKLILIYWPLCHPNDIPRLLLREWACARTNERGRAVIACPSTSALVLIQKASKDENWKGLKSWLEEEVFPVMSKKLDDDLIAAENITIYIDRQSVTGNLKFTLVYNESL